MNKIAFTIEVSSTLLVDVLVNPPGVGIRRQDVLVYVAPYEIKRLIEILGRVERSVTKGEQR
jgi:hypothetical protein